MGVTVISNADVTTKLGGEQHQVTVGSMVTSSLQSFCIIMYISGKTYFLIGIPSIPYCR